MLGHFDIWIAGLASFGFVGRGKLMITNVSKEISVGRTSTDSMKKSRKLKQPSAQCFKNPSDLR